MKEKGASIAKGLRLNKERPMVFFKKITYEWELKEYFKKQMKM